MMLGSSDSADLANLLSMEEDLSVLERDIVQTRKALNQLMLQRERTRTIVQTNRSRFPPVNRMSFDVMKHIFTRCLPDNKFIKPGVLEAPLVLSQICHSWRKAALSMPNLWNSLYIDLSGRQFCERIALMRCWLSRSGKCPLLLSCYVPREADEAVSAFLDVLNSNIFRCKELQLVVPHYYYGPVQDVISRRTQSMPWLETLGIGFLSSPSDYWEPEPGLSIDIPSAPRLRTFAWKSEELHRSVFILPWAQLFCIDVDTTMDTCRCVEILRQCPLLRICHFRTVCQQSSLSSSSLYGLHRFPHHHLQSLNIWTDQPLGPFFHSFTFPALQDVKIINIGNSSHLNIWSSQKFCALISRSKCSLRSLNLVQILRYDTDLVECLIDTTNSLVELRIVAWNTPLFTDEVFRLLTMETVGGSMGKLSLCPKLEVIRLCGPLVSRAAATASPRMVKSRPKIRFSHQYSIGGSGSYRKPVSDGNTGLSGVHPMVAYMLAGMDVVGD